MLVDTFGRTHDYLRVSLTDKCNLRCTYCMPENPCFSPGHQLMSADEIITIAQTFTRLGVKKIRLTGGEPLVRKDAAGIISRLAELKTELAITTNGVIVDEFIDLFKKAGIRSINLSLDSLQEDKFLMITRRDLYEKVIRNIKLLVDNDFHVKLNTVVIKGFNDNELIDFVALTENSSVHVRFIEFMPFSGNQWDWEKTTSYAEMLNQISNIFPVEKLPNHPNDTAKSYRVKGFKGTFAVISTMTSPFCSGCNRLRLTADGKMKNCLFSQTETDLLTPLRNGEDILPLILDCVKDKKAERGGMPPSGEAVGNRSMVRIGG